MSKPQELQTIDTAALAQVSGGVAQVPPTTSTDPLAMRQLARSRAGTSASARRN